MANNKAIFSVDLGGTNLKAALLNNKFNIIAKDVIPTPRSSSKNVLINAIDAALRELLRSSGVKKRMLLGAGLGVPGPVDYPNGVVRCFPNIPGWRNVPLRKVLQARLRLPVFIDNDANLMCLAESRVGAAKKADNVVALTLGTGVGGAIIIGKKLYRGGSFFAGEIGHIPLNMKGPKCACGGQACLERYAGNRAVEALIRKKFGRGFSLAVLSELSAEGNKKAVRIWEVVGVYLGVAVSSVVNILNPDIIVIGGGVAEAGEVLFSKIRATVLKRAMPGSAANARIVKAELGNDAGLKGAAILVMDNF